MPNVTDHLVRVGLAYKFNAANAKGWYILADLRQNSHGQVELICKGAEAHNRIFTRDQITHSKTPKTVILENEEFVTELNGVKYYRGDIVYWPQHKPRGRKPRQVVISEQLKLNSVAA